MRKEWFVLLVQLILFPLAIYAAAVTRDRDTRQIQQWVAENFVAKGELATYQREHDKWSSERTAVLLGKIDIGIEQNKRTLEILEQLNRRMDRFEDRLNRNP